MLSENPGYLHCLGFAVYFLGEVYAILVGKKTDGKMDLSIAG